MKLLIKLPVSFSNLKALCKLKTSANNYFREARFLLTLYHYLPKLLGFTTSQVWLYPRLVHVYDRTRVSLKQPCITSWDCTGNVISSLWIRVLNANPVGKYITLSLLSIFLWFLSPEASKTKGNFCRFWIYCDVYIV